MDFLDPKKKRSQSIKLAVGHMLMLAIVVIGTFILVLQTYGFDVNRKTGEVIQNGLVFMDSAPDGAELKLNGNVQAQRTNTRLTLPEGKYSAEISKSQYRTWKKDFELKGGSIERFTYPTLFLSDLVSSDVRSFDKQIGLYTQSPDRRWVLIGEKNNIRELTEYDLNTLKNDVPASQSITLPSGLFTSESNDNTLTVEEWSTNNKEVLLRHRWPGGSEFVVLNREDPSKSFNVNKQLNISPTSVKLFDKKTDKLFIYQAKTKLLTTVDTKSLQTTQVATNVINFEPYGDNVLLLAVINSTDKDKATVVVKEGSDTYNIHDIPRQSDIKLALSRYDDNWYVVFNEEKASKTYIYKEPVSYIKRLAGSKPVPLMVLKNENKVDELNFSQNTQFIMARSGQSFAVYDIEYDRTFRFEVGEKFDKGSKVLWMDGHRLITSHNDKVFLFEFDGTNKQELISANPALPATFNRDYTVLYTLGTSKESKKPALQKTELRLEEDK